MDQLGIVHTEEVLDQATEPSVAGRAPRDEDLVDGGESLKPDRVKLRTIIDSDPDGEKFMAQDRIADDHEDAVHGRGIEGKINPKNQTSGGVEGYREPWATEVKPRRRDDLNVELGVVNMDHLEGIIAMNIQGTDPALAASEERISGAGALTEQNGMGRIRSGRSAMVKPNMRWNRTKEAFRAAGQELLVGKGPLHTGRNEETLIDDLVRQCVNGLRITRLAVALRRSLGEQAQKGDSIKLLGLGETLLPKTKGTPRWNGEGRRSAIQNCHPPVGSLKG